MLISFSCDVILEITGSAYVRLFKPFELGRVCLFV